jgi:hypothetical protein
VNNIPQYTPSEKMDQLLMALAMMCKRPGKTTQVDVNCDYPLAYAEDAYEAAEYVKWLADRGFTEGSSDTVWLAATWFADELDVAWTEGIKPAIEDCKLTPLRLKELVHNEKIDDRIIAEIRACRFLIADVTGARAAVYYEAGFAHGLGKQVLWTCRADWADRLCFDTRQFSHSIWTSPQELRKLLAAKITALNL